MGCRRIARTPPPSTRTSHHRTPMIGARAEDETGRIRPVALSVARLRSSLVRRCRSFCCPSPNVSGDLLPDVQDARNPIESKRRGCDSYFRREAQARTPHDARNPRETLPTLMSALPSSRRIPNSVSCISPGCAWRLATQHEANRWPCAIGNEPERCGRLVLQRISEAMGGPV
jgi:hypothetical protein